MTILSVPIQEKYFHVAAVAPGDGAEMKLHNSNYVFIEVSSTGELVAFAGKFQGKVFNNSTYIDIFAVKSSSGDVDEDFVADGTYKLDVFGLNYVRAKLDSLTNGTVTVRGKEIR